jgi:hypothetical protein
MQHCKIATNHQSGKRYQIRDNFQVGKKKQYRFPIIQITGCVGVRFPTKA